MSEYRRNIETDLGKEQAAEQLETFAHLKGLGNLAGLFGTTELPADTGERLKTLQKIAQEHWDFRKGAERQAVDWNDELIDQEDSEQWETIFAAADEYGLVKDTEPIVKTPDYLIVLGAANNAPQDRLNYGIEHVDGFGSIVYLGSQRPLGEKEKEIYATPTKLDESGNIIENPKCYAEGAETEFDLGCAAIEVMLKKKLGLDIGKDVKIHEQLIDRELENGQKDKYGVRIYDYEQDGEHKQAFAVSTPREVGLDRHRANTYDNYNFFMDWFGKKAKQPDTSIVAVTTGFYRMGQHLPGVSEVTLPYGTHLETIGHSADYSGVKRKASQLLMETKSAIDAACRLYDKLRQNEQ